MKIGIRSDAGEAGGWQTLQSAELARQVRLVGIAVLDGEQRPAGSPMSSPGGQRVGPRQGPAVPTVSSLTQTRVAERPACACSGPAAAKAARSPRHRAGRTAQRGGSQSFIG